jgi:small subunit ribosomal protein S27
MYYELDSRYNQLKIISAIDVDIFVNAVKDDLHLDEVEDLVHKLRLCSEAGKILPSTHHALIRTLLQHGDSEELIRILNDRLNYGIFPDHYCTILMLDKFVKDGKFRDAAKIASLQMLQEDFSNPLINYYSLYACHKFILNPTEWEKQEMAEEKNEEEDEDEEVRVRVDFIRNPFFDEHFDLTTSDDLIGKTLIMIGDTLSNSVGHTYKLVGQGMFKKLDSAKVHLETILKKKEKIFEFGLTFFCDILTKLPAKEGEEGAKQENLVKELQGLVKKVQDEGLVEKEDVLLVVEQTLKKLIAEKEPEILKTQMEVRIIFLNILGYPLESNINALLNNGSFKLKKTIILHPLIFSIHPLSWLLNSV